MRTRIDVRPVNFDSAPLVVVRDGDGDEDVRGALVRLSPVLDAAQRASFDRGGAKHALLERGATAVRWAPKMVTPRMVAGSAEPATEGDAATVAEMAEAWIVAAAVDGRTEFDAIVAVRSILAHAGVSG